MRKAFVLALAVLLTLSLAVPAAAKGSPTAPGSSSTSTSSTAVGTANAVAPAASTVTAGKTAAATATAFATDTTFEDGTVVIAEPVTAENAGNLSEEAQKDYATAQTSLAQNAPTDMRAQYFFYVTLVKTDADRTFKENYDGAVNMVVKVEKITNVVVKQFVNDQWVSLEAVINADGTVTIKGVVEGPIAIFTK